VSSGVLTRIQVRNFQSHPATTVDLSPGINAFIGESDQGKSAVLRGLLWAIDNRPSGDAIVSDWARDEKGVLTDECSVTVDSTAGNLRRIKTKSRNGYDVNGLKLDAIRTGVPAEVSSFFGIEAVNVQRQLDPPFLLADSGGARARFFNQLIKLEEIDQTMSAAESLRRATAAAIKPLEADIATTEASLAVLQGLPGVRDKAEALREDEDQLRILEARKAALAQLLSSLRAAREEVTRFSGLEAIEAAADTLAELVSELSQKGRRYNGLHGVVTSLRETKAALLRLPWVPRVEDVLTDLEVDTLLLDRERARRDGLRDVLAALAEARTTAALPDPAPVEASLGSVEKLLTARARFVERERGLRLLVNEIRNKRAQLPYIDQEIEALLASLPDTCPTCGAPMKGSEHGEDRVA
jgi:hypothetical protein